MTCTFTTLCASSTQTYTILIHVLIFQMFSLLLFKFITMKQGLYVPNVRLSNYGKRCISFAAAMKWNGLPAEIKAAPSLRVFKRRIKTHLLSSLNI
jgi:hypothetical protein